MKRVRGLALLLSFLLFNTNKGVSQKTDWPKTLLWQISGKDLKKPSFLFGTMHLQDKRIFNLGDSFYHHFERAEGFAIEVDFKEYMDSLFTKAFQVVEERELADEEEGIKDVKIEAPDTAVLDIEAPPPPKEVSKSMKKYFRKLRNERIKRLLVYGQMPTILDAYLYGMAMKQGKWLGAVEEVKDQLNIRDELGKDIDEEEEMKLPEDKMMFSLENMIKIYLAQDMNRIEDYLDRYGSAKAKTIVFNNRNLKMVRSIDSLSHIRSMFYAVGAAHLPGDSGVIKLLRNKGYTVTPVISGNTMAAEKYAEKLPATSWYEVGQADSLYSIDMPGIPSEYNMFGELVKMKIFVDITTMTYYMTGHTIAQYEDDKLADALKEMAKSMSRTGRLENTKKVDRNDIKGVEGLVTAPSVNFRVQVLKKGNTAFFLMMGGDNKNKLNTSDADKFFYSFKTGKTKTETNQNNWKEFSLPEKAVSVMLPSTPKKNKSFEKQADGSGWNFSVYDCTDLAAGLYYLFQVRDINAGHFLDGDSSFFELFKENLLQDKITKLREEKGLHNGYPSMRFDAESDEEALFYKTKNVVRGNRVYTLMVLGHKSQKGDNGPDYYFNSLKLTDYKLGNSTQQSADDNTFSSWVPAKFELAKKEDEEGDDSTRVHYTSYNPNEAVSYEVIKDKLPAFYWTEADTSFYRGKANEAKGYNDSVLSYINVRNGNITGVEQVVQSPGSNNLKRMRYLLHGDTLYTLLAFVPSQHLNDTRHNDFFSKFSIRNDKVKPTIFTSKAKLLLEALQSKDSATAENAKNMLDKVSFTKADLPLLHKAFLVSYPDDTLYFGSVRNRLINVFDGLSDSSTVDFIKDNYEKLGDRGSDKLAMLNLLVDYKTIYSYTTLKDLFVNKTPTKLGNRSSVGYGVTDSLDLAKLLYPDILALLKNGDFWQDVANYTSTLLDSNTVEPSMIKPYEKEILFIADTLLAGQTLKGGDIWTWPYESLLHLLGELNTTESNKMLQRYAAHPDIFLKKTAVTCLLKNDQQTDAKEIEKVAADKEYRLDFYEGLKKIKRESFFTPRYLAQRYFAESEMYQFGDEDYSPSSVEYLGEKEAIFDGQKKRFFLFRLGFNDEDGKEEETHLGIAGPYSLDSKDLKTNNDGTDIYYDEEFSKKTVDKQFKELLIKGEEYIKKKSK